MISEWLSRAYKFLWKRIGGRPWTYISRDFYHQFEYAVLVGLVAGGFWLGKSGQISWNWFLVIIAVYTVGYIHGHFFWGKEWKKGQGGDE